MATGSVALGILLAASSSYSNVWQCILDKAPPAHTNYAAHQAISWCQTVAPTQAVDKTTDSTIQACRETYVSTARSEVGAKISDMACKMLYSE